MPRLSSRQIGESDASSCWCWSCCRPNATGDQSQKKHVGKASRNMCLPGSFANKVVMFFFVMVFVMGRPICKQITKLFDLTWTFPDISNARAIQDSQFDHYTNTNVNVVYILTHWLYQLLRYHWEWEYQGELDRSESGLRNQRWISKHRKNCECCPGHYLSTSVY